MTLMSRLFGTAPEKQLVKDLNGLYAFAEEHPDDIRVHLRIADVLMKLGERQKAVEQYVHAAGLYEANRLFQIAAAIYKQVLSIDPGQIAIYHTLAELYRREGIIGDAVTTYERLARYYYDKGMKEQVIETLEKMFGVDPQSVYVKKKIARFYADKKIAPESVDRQTHGLDWELSDAITSGRSSLRKTDQGEGAFFDLGAALEDDLGNDPDALAHDSLSPAGIPEATLPGFDEIFKEIRQEGSAPGEQDDSLYHFNLGIAFHRIGRYDEAKEELIKALEDPVRITDCYLMLAACAREQKMFAQAIKYLKEGLQGKNLSPEKEHALHYEMAVTYKMKGRMRKAHKLFKKIHAADCNFREVQQQLADVS